MYNMNQVVSTIPFIILEILILHQTPFNPKRFGEDKIKAAGILSPVSIVLTRDGGNVFPIPLNAPAVAISMHIKNWDTPSILR